MRLKRKLILLLTVVALLCFSFACNHVADEDKGNRIVADLSINNGFEDEGSDCLIDGSAGVGVSLNTNKSFVNSGEKSLKLTVRNAPVPKFAFSDRLIEKDISEYEYLSFWMYIDGEYPLSLSNTANDGVYQGTTVVNRYYIKDSVEPRTWVKIKISKGDAFFDNMQYFVPYGKFILCGTGDNLNASLDYDVYIDDIRVYKKGMTGETELYAVDSDYEIMTKLPDGAVGQKYELPRIMVVGADGSELFGETVNYFVYDSDRNEVEIKDGAIITDKAGMYSLTATCLKDGYLGKYNNLFDVKFVNVIDKNTELAVVGERYEIPSLDMTDPKDGSLSVGATVGVKVFDGKGKGIKTENNSFTPEKSDCYTIEYTITKKESSVENTATFKKYVWASETYGLISDFSSDSDVTMFRATDGSSKIKTSDTRAKYQSQGRGKSVEFAINGIAYPTFGFNERFPYENMAESGIEYFAFWVYNGCESDLYLTYSGNLLERHLLVSGIWNRVIFYANSFSEQFNLRNGEFTVYSADASGEKLNASLYFDDVRAYREGYAEETSFSEYITRNDYNENTGEGVRFAVNGSYKADTRVYAFGNDTEEIGDATVISVKDSTGATVAVKNGEFIPAREGWHVIELCYEKDGIENSVTKKFFVRPQLEFNPGTDSRDAVMPYGEAGTVYDAGLCKPVLWNKGSIADENEVLYSINVIGTNGKKVSVDGLKFTPTKKGLYTISFYAQDVETKEFATYSVKFGVFEKGKKGIAYDFEDGNLSDIKSTYYWYGVVSEVKLDEENVGGNTSKKAKIEVTNESVNGSTAREPMFYLSEKNMLQNVSLTKSFSFDIYIADTENRSFNLSKVLYYNWNNQGAAEVQRGTLQNKIQSNGWVTVTIEREDYEKVLGGYIFGGCTLSLGGQAWTEIDDRLITAFYLVDSTGYKECGGITIYLDNFRVEV